MQFFTAPSKLASRTTSSITSSRSKVSRSLKRIGAVQARELQYLADQRIETLDLALQPIQLARKVRRRLARQPQRDAHAGERRAQFVRDVAQQLGGCAAIGPQLIRHGVEVARQHREFVLAPLETGADAHARDFPKPARARLLECGEWARVRCSASHQLVSALTTSAMQRMVREIAGRLSAPKMLGRRGTDKHGVDRAVGGDDLRRGARWAEIAGRRTRDPRGSSPATDSRLTNSSRRSAPSGRCRPRMSRPSGPTMNRSRSPIEFLFAASQLFSALTPPRARISDA